jgi:alpha-L-fucosidase
MKEVVHMNIANRPQQLREIEQVIAAGKYQDSWESLSRFEVPVWYRSAKFGIFIHWGLYSVPERLNLSIT